MLNLSKLSPDKQLAAVIAACRPGETPDLPPFLVVDAAEQARRNEWAKAHPLTITTSFMERDSQTEAQRQADRESRAAIAAEQAAASAAAAAEKHAAKHVRVDMTGFTWDHRRGRFIPDGYVPPKNLTAKRSDEEIHMAEAQHAVNAKRKPTKAKAAAPVAKPVGSNKPVPVTLSRGEKETKVAFLVRMLERPEGITLAEAAEANAWDVKTAQARIGSDVKRTLGLPVNEYEEARGRVYRIEA